MVPLKNRLMPTIENAAKCMIEAMPCVFDTFVVTVRLTTNDDRLTDEERAPGAVSMTNGKREYIKKESFEPPRISGLTLL